MENEVEDMVEETEEVEGDNAAMKQLRTQLKKTEAEKKELMAFKSDFVFKEAGFDPSSGQGKALKDLYKGDLEADAIKAFAAEQYGWGESTPAVQEQEAQKERVVTSQNNLDAVIDASVPVEPANVNDQIATAMQDGDWKKSSALKTTKLKTLMENKR